MKTSVYFWPQWFKEALNDPRKRKIAPTLIKRLNQTQFYLWQSLNIYDDFLDGQGQRQKLPLANSYRRRFLTGLYRLNLPTDYYRLGDRLMADLEAADRAEVLRPRLKIQKGRLLWPGRWPGFPRPTELSRKSLALALAPLAALSYLGRPVRSRESRAALDFWRYGLAAKQLADDARDWEEDLRRGLITAANLPLLRAAKRRRLPLDPAARPEIPRLLFALSASSLAEQIKSLTAKARQKAAEAGLKPSGRLLKELLLPLEKAAAETEKFRRLLTGKPEAML